MSKYQATLIDKIENDVLLIQPKSRKNEVLGFLKNELSDLCISRPKSRLEWGIELPFDDNYVTYVWFDALINYISAIGAYSNDEHFSSLWPADVHLIGKDILTTHSVYWPTMLLSLGLPLPQRIFAHGWWLTDDQKMSKSLGNVVSPLMLIDDFGVDSVRYYLMSEMVLGMDATFSSESFEKKYNSDLANDFGNLVSRVSTLIKNNFDEKIPESSLSESDLSTNFHKIVLKEQLDNLEIDKAINDIMTFIRSINVFMEQNEPWKLVKSDKVQAGNILYHCAESLRLAAIMLSPVMPSKTKDILDILGTSDVELVWGKLKAESKISISKPVFPRIS
jgi:methionyl-tRNA synthetase